MDNKKNVILFYFVAMKEKKCTRKRPPSTKKSKDNLCWIEKKFGQNFNSVLVFIITILMIIVLAIISIIDASMHEKMYSLFTYVLIGCVGYLVGKKSMPDNPPSG